MVACISKIRVLNAYRPYHRLLTALNYENFPHSCWHHNLRGAFRALCTTLLISSLPLILLILGVWNFIEKQSGLKHIVVSMPLIFTFVLLVVTIAAMAINNRTISETITNLEKIINQRKLSLLFEIY